jgi:hypothetical protein
MGAPFLLYKCVSWSCIIVTCDISKHLKNKSGAVEKEAAPAYYQNRLPTTRIEEREKRGIPIVGVLNLSIAYIHIVFG